LAANYYSIEYYLGMVWIQVFIIIFFAIFTQSVTGFGLALVSMPLLTAVLGIKTAAPLVALFGLVAELILLIYYRQDFSLTVVWRLALASIVGVPLGIVALRHVDEQIVITILGVVVAGYALYALLDLRLPEIQQPIWAYISGFVAGVLAGAYNTAGPPVIIYGNCRRWPPAQFKSNLQGFFLFNSALVAGSHILADNYTPLVLKSMLVALPAIAVGILVGVNLAKRISSELFRKIVLWLLLAIGLWLIVGAFS
jgi:uncharacterized membrane protein YfcA